MPTRAPGPSEFGTGGRRESMEALASDRDNLIDGGPQFCLSENAEEMGTPWQSNLEMGEYRESTEPLASNCFPADYCSGITLR